MSVVMDNHAVDGYALVTPLLDPLGLAVSQVSRIDIGPEHVVINYYLLDSKGRKYANEDGDIAASRLSLPIDWSRK